MPQKRKVASCGISDMRGWNTGDNVNLAIGQGDLQATPLQLAVAYSPLANDGKSSTPHVGLEVENAVGELIQRIERAPARRIKIDETLSLGDHERPASGRQGGRRHVGRRVLRLAQGPARLRQDRHRPAHRQARHVVVRGLRPRRPPQPDRRRDAPSRSGCFGAEAAAPITRLILVAALRGREEVRRAGSRARGEHTRPAPHRGPGPAARRPAPAAGPAAHRWRRSGLAASARSPRSATPRRTTSPARRRTTSPARRSSSPSGRCVLVCHEPPGLLPAARAEVRRLRPHARPDPRSSWRFGSVARGSRRAINLPFFQFQPSELGKVLLDRRAGGLRCRPLAPAARARHDGAIILAGARAGRRW